MNKKFGLYIVLGLIVGANFGIFFGPVVGNTSLAIALGALGGVFIGWFTSAMEKPSSADPCSIRLRRISPSTASGIWEWH